MPRSNDTTRVIRAFLERRPARIRNDRTDGQTLFFHGSPIAAHGPDGQLILSCCGHNTPSTRLRLNTICKLIGNGQPFHCKAFTLHFNSSPILSDETIYIEIQSAPSFAQVP